VQLGKTKNKKESSSLGWVVVISKRKNDANKSNSLNFLSATK